MAIILDKDDLDALHSYAIEHGPKWKDALALDWYHARAEGMRGSILHGLRNNLGPSWLVDFRFAEPLVFPNLRKLNRSELAQLVLLTAGTDLLTFHAAKREIRRRATG